MFDSDINVAAEKYEYVRCGIVKYFECRGCLPALDLADETINRLARKLGEDAEIQHGSFLSYFYGVARNVFHEHLRRVDRNLAPVETLLPHQHPSVRPLEMFEGRSVQGDLEAKLACLDSCTQSLPEETRKMILSYYEGKERA